MMRKIIGKIIDLIIPVAEEGTEGEEGEQEGKPTRVITLDQILGGGAQAQKEPDLRVIGLYSDVSDEKIAELTQAILYCQSSFISILMVVLLMTCLLFMMLWKWLRKKQKFTQSVLVRLCLLEHYFSQQEPRENVRSQETAA
jgi:hypothetical protein